MIITTEINSVTEINYIAGAYNQNPDNTAAIDTIQGMIPTLRTAVAFNSSLVIAMAIGFGLTFFANGKDLRASTF
jgi:hypothetical protein